MAMTKEEWQNLFNILQTTYRNFQIEYQNMRNGKNRKIRDKGERDVNNSIQLTTIWIRKYPEAYAILTGENGSDFNRFIVWDEFQLPQWFNNDMPEFLERLEAKINSL